MLNRKGQNIAEYSILIALVIAAAVAMQVYVRRGIQGRVADAVDHAPDTDLVAGQAIQFTTKQYEPYYTESLGNVASDRTYNENIATRGQTDRTGISEKTTREAQAYEKAKWESTTAR
jgi:hypothetical protein